MPVLELAIAEKRSVLCQPEFGLSSRWFRPLVIVAEDIESEPLSALVYNRIRSQLQVCDFNSKETPLTIIYCRLLPSRPPDLAITARTPLAILPLLPAPTFSVPRVTTLTSKIVSALFFENPVHHHFLLITQ